MTVPRQELRTSPEGSQYNFGPFCLRHDGTLFRESSAVPLPPKEVAILRLLVARAGQIVSLEQLRAAACWGDVHVSADSLPRCISSLRTRLESPGSIQTIDKRGYRFELPVRRSLYRPPAQLERRTARPHTLLRLAVLPLSTAHGVPESFGAGIAAETMLRLGRASAPLAEVLARDSVFSLAARDGKAQETGAALGADLVLTGTITALPQHFRFRLEMVRVSDAVQLWAEDFILPRDMLDYADALIANRITARIRAAYPAPMTFISTHAEPTATPFPPSSHEARREEAHALLQQARDEWLAQQRSHNTADSGAWELETSGSVA